MEIDSVERRITKNGTVSEINFYALCIENIYLASNSTTGMYSWFNRTWGNRPRIRKRSVKSGPKDQQLNL